MVYNVDMHLWRLTRQDPVCLTLSADAQLSKPNYYDDQIWEVLLQGGEPPAQSIQTTYGLRARMMRVFPRFTENGVTLSDPGAFYQLPVLCQFYTNYARLTFNPFAGIDVTIEYWVPTSNTLAGRIKVANSSVIRRQMQLELAVSLAPIQPGQEMRPQSIQGKKCLAGRSGDLSPVFCIDGLAEFQTSPYSACAGALDLIPGSSATFTWGLASTTDEDSSWIAAQELIACPWDAEIARLEMQAASQIVDIDTGNPAWDAVLAFSQKVARQLFMGPTRSLPYPSFVLSRQPDQGFSRRFDGSDYDHLWDGQPAFESLYLSTLVLPGSAELVQGLILNYLDTAADNGFMDGRPGLAGQRSRFLIPPLLALLTWQVTRISQDKAFLTEVFPRLLSLANLWFEKSHDQDQDGFPEWDNSLQTGYEDNPLFDRWRPDEKGIDISCVESPTMGALLVREISSLVQIAKLIGRGEEVHYLEQRAESLKAAIESTWDSHGASYHYRDRDSHSCLAGESIGSYPANGPIVVNKKFKKNQRLLAVIDIQQDTSRTGVSLTIHGITPSGPVDETLPVRLGHWNGPRAVLTTQNIFQQVTSLDVQGLSPADRITLKTPGYFQEDITLLLPLWAHIPGKQRAKNLVKKSIHSTERYWREHGLGALPGLEAGEKKSQGSPVYMLWNTMVGEGLLMYGYRNEAAQLVQKLLDTTAQSLRQMQSFYKMYDSDSARPGGEKNVIDGLAPLGFYLQTLGVQIISPTHVIINGENPFANPVTVRYRGLTVKRDSRIALITFPDGQTVRVTGSGSHDVSLS